MEWESGWRGVPTLLPSFLCYFPFLSYLVFWDTLQHLVQTEEPKESDNLDSEKARVQMLFAACVESSDLGE